MCSICGNAFHSVAYNYLSFYFLWAQILLSREFCLFQYALFLFLDWKFVSVKSSHVSGSLPHNVFFGLFAISWATPVAHRISQASGPIRAVAAGLHHSHSNAGSELRLQPTPQLMATPDP